MSIYTSSTNWGIMSITSINGGLALSVRGTIYALANFDNRDRYLFALADLGMGPSFGLKVNKGIKALYKWIKNSNKLEEPGSYTMIECNREFSASDLHLSPGAEATFGVTLLVAGRSTTAISAWPFFQGAPKPGQEVNNDYFSGVEVVSSGIFNDFGLGITAAWSFYGRWLKLLTM